jgi:hypothetical protein
MSLHEIERDNLVNLTWNMKDHTSMEEAQIQLNDLLLTRKLTADELKILKEKLKALQRDYKARYIHLCNVCGYKYDMLDEPMNSRELLFINKSWGYESKFDREIHELAICDVCYKNTIYTTFKDVMKIKRY